MNADTPETDRRIIQQDPRMCGCGYKSEITYADFARRLERERNQARKERDELREALVAMVCCAESKIEPIESLYQAREILEKLKEPNDPQAT